MIEGSCREPGLSPGLNLPKLNPQNFLHSVFAGLNRLNSYHKMNSITFIQKFVHNYFVIWNIFTVRLFVIGNRLSVIKDNKKMLNKLFTITNSSQRVLWTSWRKFQSNNFETVKIVNFAMWTDMIKKLQWNYDLVGCYLFNYKFQELAAKGHQNRWPKFSIFWEMRIIFILNNASILFFSSNFAF